MMHSWFAQWYVWRIVKMQDANRPNESFVLIYFKGAEHFVCSMRHHRSPVWNWTEIQGAFDQGHHGDCDVCMSPTYDGNEITC